MDCREIIRQKASELGFTLCGFSPLYALPREEFLRQWIDQGYAGEMAYMRREPERRLDPRRLLPQAKTVVSLGFPYHPPRLPDTDWRAQLRGRIAAYAAGEDYHRVLRRKLNELLSFLRQHFPMASARPYVDTGAVLEREWAYRSGLGWFGKNTNLLTKRGGSWFLLAEVLIDIAVEAEPLPRDHCGTCRRCVAACPTDALRDGYLLDSRLCISYLTIEHRGVIPRELRSRMDNWIFGCDICQDVCPWNQKFGRPDERLTEELFPPLPPLLAMTKEDFHRRFAQSPIRRAQRGGFLRNVAIALGNSGNPEAVSPLLRALEDPEPLVRGHAAWALGRLGGKRARAGLARASTHENDSYAYGEILAALETDVHARTGRDSVGGTL